MQFIRHPLLAHNASIYLSGFNALMVLLVGKIYQEFYQVRLMAIISFFIFFLLLWNKRNNILFFMRTLILGGIGYFPIMVKVVLGPFSFFSGYEKRTQNFDIVVLMYGATALALLGNEIGLFLGAKKRRSINGCSRLNPSFWKIISSLSILIILVVSIQSILSAGKSVLTASYASETGPQLFLGNTIAIGIICLLAMWVALLRQYIKFGLPFFIITALFFLGYSQLLMGYRQDVLSTFLGMAVCYGLVKQEAFPLKAKTFLVICILIIAFEIWGTARQMIFAPSLDYLDMAFSVIRNVFNPETVQFGTVSPIATTFSNTVWLIETNRLDFTWGRSYWEFILRTPPEFIYPDRPGDYAWMFGEYGLQAAGGFFELAEAYMNFGLFGAFFVPALISFLLSKAFFHTLTRQTNWSYFLLFTFLGVFFRGTWYQTFAFYKSFLTVLVLYGFFRFLFLILTGALGEAPSPSVPNGKPISSGALLKWQK